MDLKDWLIVVLMFLTAAVFIGTIIYLMQLMGYQNFF